MIVISNTSPIINLAAIGQLELLRKLYEKVVIPGAVLREAASSLPEGAIDLSGSWIVRKEVSDDNFVKMLRAELDEGEAEAIALSIELKADLLLMDERRGRSVAARFGIRFVGLLGVLIEAKRQNHISAVKPVVDELIAAGFWISRQLYDRVLEAAGE